VAPAAVGTDGGAGGDGGLFWGEAGVVTQQYAMAGILRDDRLGIPGTGLESVAWRSSVIPQERRVSGASVGIYLHCAGGGHGRGLSHPR
jgi:hypothetical protein